MDARQRLRTLTEAASRGDFHGADRVLEVLVDERSVEADATAAAFEAMRFFAQPELGVLRPVAELERFVGGSEVTRAAAAVVCVQHERSALLSFDLGSFEDALAMHRRLCEPQAPWLLVAECWRALALGDPLPVPTASLAQAAREGGDAALAIEAAVLRSLAALSMGDLDEAVASARRASRMSRTEALPQPEYLANVVLARVRRLTDRPHLATRILTALHRYASPPWHPWLRWELLLASGPASAPNSEPLTPGRATEAVRAVSMALDAASRGDRPRFDEAARQLLSSVGGLSFIAREAESLVRLTDHSSGWEHDEFLRGEITSVPFGLSGLGIAVSESDTVAWVLAHSQGSARRVLSSGLGLATAEGAITMPAAAGKQARTEATLATLALAGSSGMTEEELFRALYGFEYVHQRHKGVRRVLYHRARDRLADLGAISRSDGRVRLDVQQSILIPDPRCAPRHEHDILEVLARWGHASPKRAAEELDIPLRTVQEALRRLAEEGVCRIERHGRRIDYHLDDSVFAEPTTEREIELPEI